MKINYNYFLKLEIPINYNYFLKFKNFKNLLIKIQNSN